MNQCVVVLLDESCGLGHRYPPARGSNRRPPAPQSDALPLSCAPARGQWGGGRGSAGRDGAGATRRVGNREVTGSNPPRAPPQPPRPRGALPKRRPAGAVSPRAASHNRRSARPCNYNAPTDGPRERSPVSAEVELPGRAFAQGPPALSCGPGGSATGVGKGKDQPAGPGTAAPGRVLRVPAALGHRTGRAGGAPCARRRSTAPLPGGVALGL